MDRQALIRRLEQVVGPQGVISERNQLRTYECDGLANFRVVPSVVVLPETADQAQGVVRACHEAGVPFVARGSGTGLSGGALPVSDGVLIVLARMRRILEVDLDNQRAVVEPGVLNLQVTKEVAGDGFYYAPDPSSQQVCSIGGNVAENSGGVHCLKYGVTVNHVLGLGPVQLHHQDRAGTLGVVDVHGRLGRLHGQGVHHLDRRREDPGRDHT